MSARVMQSGWRFFVCFLCGLLSGIEVIYRAGTGPLCEVHCELLLCLIKKLSKVRTGLEVALRL